MTFGTHPSFCYEDMITVLDGNHTYTVTLQAPADQLKPSTSYGSITVLPFTGTSCSSVRRRTARVLGSATAGTSRHGRGSSRHCCPCRYRQSSLSPTSDPRGPSRSWPNTMGSKCLFCPGPGTRMEVCTPLRHIRCLCTWGYRCQARIPGLRQQRQKTLPRR